MDLPIADVDSAEQLYLAVKEATSMINQLYLESLIPDDPENPESPSSMEIDQFPCVVGRATECDYQIANPLVSRRHCYFFKRDDEILMRDLGSRNGTHLNGEVVVGEKPVHEGDRIDIGYLPYRIHMSRPSRIERFLHGMMGERRKSSGAV
jgi:pSer/pThr/pTyr-binding forkhead associated (FHA) protein